MNRYINTKTKQEAIFKSNEKTLKLPNGDEWTLVTPKTTIVVPATLTPKLETKPLPPSTK